jgi:hypothetical protein
MSSRQQLQQEPEQYDYPALFLQQIKVLKGGDFGSCLIDQLELVGNDWYQRQQNSKLPGRFLLQKKRLILQFK